MENFQKLSLDVSKELRDFRDQQPDVHGGFMAMSKAIHKDGALDVKTKELIATGIAVATHCRACIGYHVQTLVKLGISEDEFMEMLSVAVYMGGGPSLMSAGEAIGAWKEMSSK